MTHPRLYIPGPTEVAPDVLAAQTRPLVGHRSAEFSDLFYGIAAKLKCILQTEQNVFILTASGSGLQEAAVRNAVRPGRKILNVAAGAFGDRWQKIAVGNGCESVRVDLDWGQPVRPEDVDRHLAAGGFDAVTIVHNETSTAVMSDVAAIAELVRARYPDVLILVDAVSSAGGAPIHFDDWGLDLLLTSSQKALALPPGLAFAAASDRFLAQAAEVPHRGWYFDLVLLDKYFRDGRTTPATPAIGLLYAADCQFDRILAEGMEARWARHQACMTMTHAWAHEHGFELFAARGYESRTVTCIRNNVSIDIPAMIKHARSKGMVIGNGYGQLKNQAFRIAHMGELTEADMAELFGVLDDYLAI
ncbi:MAG: alanine--glyoxylate aminotransferase family protein [Caldilineales bacterium]|nr:alanine--glyoxylate aminotransferase family protein [Caldilineales bacterium]